jgi:hypothetical protein
MSEQLITSTETYKWTRYSDYVVISADSCSAVPGFDSRPYAASSEVGGPCSTNGEKEERVLVVGGKTRGKEATRKTST